jgi:hypothetical protein
LLAPPFNLTDGQLGEVIEKLGRAVEIALG